MKARPAWRTLGRHAVAAACAFAAWAAQAALDAPLWLDVAGRPSSAARDALQALSDAATDGLAPQDYRADALRSRAAALEGPATPPGDASTAFDRDLTAAMQSFLHDLHFGRADPRALGFRVGPRLDTRLEVDARLNAAAAQGRIAQAVTEARPRFGQYSRLREALMRYRTIASDSTFTPLPGGTGVKPGEPYSAADALRQRLVAFGDLTVDVVTPADRFDGALVEGLRRFQLRHGLAADGVLGRATRAALEVPPARRVQQLELALERLRWLPEPGTRPFVAINIPMFRLWAWDPNTPAAEPLGIGVIVGRALNTQTPVLVEEMRYVIFRPYWNVPRSIARNEVLPAMRHDPQYLERNMMEIVRGEGDDARPVAASAESLAALAQGTLRVRQRPGPKNSLGLVKFIFPNDANVYLHGTPAVQLFGRDRRDFSHGCVRVEDPVALAMWVLRDQPQWSRERIEAAMHDTASRRVDLLQPVPVILYYMTAMVTGAEGSVRFADDLYGHDARLLRALAARRAR